ncbi:HNH endonuclease [Mycobacterium phage PegLeg]|uniref:HNH endonuclease n=1 Tax=Mycobacterium phage PegLeg TaxID=1325953 RepID=R4TIX6_9CAUD|nr:HNH endonuclease [Mycobacterium phage PegLeg]AGM12341.1 HNH endonuclease [Mycobacterium phage PegLeg]
MRKRCPRCGVEKDCSEFYKNARRKDGLQPYCKRCHKDTNNEWYANSEKRRTDIKRRRKAHIEMLQEHLRQHLIDNPCVDCGESDLVVLDLDHRDGESKVKEVAKLIRDQVSLEKFQAEIAKCDTRCANCHRRMTARRHGAWWRSKDIAV